MSSTNHSAVAYFSVDQAHLDSGDGSAIALTLWTDVNGDGYTAWIDPQERELVVSEWTDGVGSGDELYREPMQFKIAPSAVYRFEQYGNPSTGGTFEVVDQINGAPYNETSNADVWHILDDDVTAVPSLTATDGTLGVDVYQDYYDIGTRTSQAYAIQSGIDGTSNSIAMEIYCLRPTDITQTIFHVYARAVGGEYSGIFTNPNGVFADVTSGTTHTISEDPAADISYIYMRAYWPASKIATRTQSEISNSGTSQSTLSYTDGGGDEFTASDKLFDELYFDPRSVMPFPDGDIRWANEYQAPGYWDHVDLVQTDYAPQLAATADTFTHLSPGRFWGNDWAGILAPGDSVTSGNSDINGQVGLAAVAGSWTYEDSALTTTAYGSRAIETVVTSVSSPNVTMPIAGKIDDWRQMSFVASFDRTDAGIATFRMSDGTSAYYVGAQTYFGHADYDLVFYAGANPANGFSFEGLTFGTSYRVDLAANFPDEMRARLIDPETNLVIQEDSYDMSGVYIAGDPDGINLVEALAYNSAGTTTLVLDFLGSIADNDTVEGVWPRYRETTGALTATNEHYAQLDVTRFTQAVSTTNVNAGSRGTIDVPQTTIYLNNMAAATPGGPVLALTSGGESGQPLQGNDPGYIFSDVESYSAGVSVTMDGTASAGVRSLDWAGTGSTGTFLRCFFYMPAGTPVDIAPTSFWLIIPGADNYTGGVYWRSTTDAWEVADDATGGSVVDVTSSMPTAEGWYLMEIEKDWTQGGSGNMVVTTTISNPDGTEPVELAQTTLARGTANSDVKFLFATAGGSLDETLFIDGLGWGIETSFPLDSKRLRVTSGDSTGGVVGALGVSAAVLPLDPGAVSLPTVRVEVAMGQRMVDGPDALTWTDVTDFVRVSNGLNFSRGRLTEGEIATPGQLAVTFNNNDARFTPSLTSGPYGDGFRARVPIRVTQVDADFPLWLGYVTDIIWNGEGNDYVVQVQAVDTLGLFARTELRGGYAERFRVLPEAADALGITAERLGVWSFSDQDTGKQRQAIKGVDSRDGWLEPVKTTEADSPRFQAGVADVSLDGSPVLSLVTDNSNGNPNNATNQRHAGYRAILPFPEPTTDLGNQQFGDGRSMVSMLVNLSDVSTLGASAESRMTLAAWGFEDYRASDFIADPQRTVAGAPSTGESSQKFIGRFCVSGIDEGYYTFSYEPKMPTNIGGAFYTDGRITGEYRVRVDDIPDGWAHIVLVDASDIDDYDYLASPNAEFFANQSATLYVNGVKVINHAPAERPTGLALNSDISAYYNDPTDLGRYVGRMLPNPNAGVDGRGNTNGGALIMAGATTGRKTGDNIGAGAYGPGVYARPFQGLISWVSVWALNTPSIAAIEPLALELSGVQQDDNFTERVEALALLSRSGEWLEADQDGTFNVSRQSLDANLFDLLANAATVEGGAILPQASGIVRAVSDQGRIRRVPTLVLSAESEVMQLSGMFSVDDSEDSDSVAVTMRPTGTVVIENEAGVDRPIEQAALEIHTDDEIVARSIAAGLANKPNIPDAPTITVSMSAAFRRGQHGGVLALELGDRVRVVDLPAASGFSELEFTVESVEHAVGQQDWLVTINMSPAAVSDSVIVGDIINTSEVIR